MLMILTLLVTVLGSVKCFAQEQDDKIIGMQFSSYSESDLSGLNTSLGVSADRHSNSMKQFYLYLPINDKLSLETNIASESVSGRIPSYLMPTNIELDSDDLPLNDRPKVVMSAEPIEDTRQEASLKAIYVLNDLVLGSTVGISDEEDFNSFFIGLEGEMDLNDRHQNIEAGLGWVNGEVEPTLGNIPTADAASSEELAVQREGGQRDSVYVFAGFSQIINRVSTIRTGLSITRESGFLSDSYALVGKYTEAVFGTNTDRRPDSRTEIAWTIKYRHYFKGKGTLHADYRHYSDSWNIVSHTFDVSWYISLRDNWQIMPGLRYYSQGEAEFYDPYFLFDREDGYYSSDYRLSPYGAVSLRIKATREIESWRINLLVEHYNSDKDFGLGNVKLANPALLDYTYLTFGFQYSF